MKMFEEFMQSDYEMDQIIKKVKQRITYWFQNGAFSLSAAPVDSTTSSPSSKRSIVTNFADANFYYQMIMRFAVEDLENCDVIIKKYDPSKIDEAGGGEPIWTIELTNDKQVKIDDVKEDFIIQKISEKDDNTKEDPDENKIEVPKEKQQPQAQQPAAGAPGMPPAPGGEMPPTQGAAPFPETGAPPTEGAPPTL
jgi:hypothetical protein